MGYSNKFNLAIVESQKEIKEIFVCSKCKTEHKSGKFCSECGSQLEKIEKEVCIDDEEIIAKLREESEEADYLLDECGDCRENGSGYSLKDEIIEFSRNYPDALFRLDVEWEQGLQSEPSRYYIQNGRIQDCKVTIVFEDFDPDKLMYKRKNY